MKSIRVPLSGQELATLEKLRAMGFSSNAEILRCATLAWAEAAVRLPEGVMPTGSEENPMSSPSPTPP